MDFDKLFSDIAKLKVAVIGDAMLDTYWWGHAERISPEAPVPIVAVSKKEKRIGGAANVALNLRALDTEVFLLSVVGNDTDGKTLIELCKKENIDTRFIYFSDHRITTNKIRIISRNQQMMRLDAEIIDDLNKDDEQIFLDSFNLFIDQVKPDVVILEDYNKGLLTPLVIAHIIEVCNQKNIVVTVDPKRKNFFSYKNVDVFKPNFKEVKEALNIIEDEHSLSFLSNTHNLLHQQLAHKISFITLSEKGVFCQADNNGEIISSHVRNVADVSGAGDTVIAVASAVYAVTKDRHHMAAIANIAGGLVCEEVGTVAIDKNKLLAECKHLLN
ncbi:MAG: PfkB family carbohydrate kinase [Bacteroidota bacterium]